MLKFLVCFAVLVVGVMAFLTPYAGAAPGDTERTIALTFDDAPRGDGPILDGAARTQELIEQLLSADVGEVMFFVTTGHMDKDGDSKAARLRAYTGAGHLLGNHSHTHSWLSRSDVDLYVADLDQAAAVLDGFENVLPYYRFPYLDEGRETDKRDSLRIALKERELKNGYVTVDTYDWYLAALAKEVRGDAQLEALGDLYVDVIIRSVEFYDSMAQDVLGRSPHHVLLLHENDLAALFIADLTDALRSRGFAIVSPDEAFGDSIANREPDTLYLGQGRIAALAHESGWPPAKLVSPTENEEYLRQRFDAEVLMVPASH